MPALGIAFVLLIAAGAIWHFKMLHSAHVDASLTGAGSPGVPLETIDDPILAEAVFLFALGRVSGEPVEAIRGRIGHQIAGIAPGAETELADYAEWASRSAGDAKDCIRRFKPLWTKRLSAEQRARLVNMAESVARQGGIIPSGQKITIAALRLSLA